MPGIVKPKVLMLLSNKFDPDPRVHREARALVEDGYKVTICCWDRDEERKIPAHEVCEGIRIWRIYVKSTHGRGISQMFFLWLFWLKAFFSMLCEPAGIIHAHDFDTLPLAFCLAKLKKACLVYDAHENYVDMMHHLPSLLKRMIVAGENFIMKRCDLVITVGDILKEYLVSRGANNVCVVGNWQDIDSFLFSSAVISKNKRQLGIRADQKAISFIANLGVERQLPQLLAAVAQAPDVFLILGGDGQCRPQAEAASRENENICYLGRVNPAQIPLYTALSDAVFYGFDPQNPNARFSAPNKLFEALAAGKPVITGDFGEISRIVKQYACGIVLSNYNVLNIKNALDKLTSKKVQVWSENAGEAAKNYYNWTAAAFILRREYEKISSIRTGLK